MGSVMESPGFCRASPPCTLSVESSGGWASFVGLFGVPLGFDDLGICVPLIVLLKGSIPFFCAAVCRYHRRLYIVKGATENRGLRIPRRLAGARQKPNCAKKDARCATRRINSDGVPRRWLFSRFGCKRPQIPSAT